MFMLLVIATHFDLLLIYSGDGGRGASIFVGGFVLGGIVVGALGCIYAPQVTACSCVCERELHL